jgi:hypothetical protein
VAEEARKEGPQEFPYRVASPEFFFLLQRIDRLDEKLTAEIASLRQELKATEAGLRQEIKAAEAGLRSEVAAVWNSLGGTLRWVTGLVLAALALAAAVALKVWI